MYERPTKLLPSKSFNLFGPSLTPSLTPSLSFFSHCEIVKMKLDPRGEPLSCGHEFTLHASSFSQQRKLQALAEFSDAEQQPSPSYISTVCYICDVFFYFLFLFYP